jgi:Type-F conjugative transfer system protein (TrbI_Ftype)
MENTNTENPTEATVKPAPEATKANVPAVNDESGQFVTLSSLLIVVAIAIAITLAVVFAAASKGWIPLGGSSSKVVTLDVDRLIEAGLKANEKKGPGVDAKAEADKFQANLKAEVDRLASEGHLVINYRAVIAGTKQSDVTDDVIAHLGLGDKGSAK